MIGLLNLLDLNKTESVKLYSCEARKDLLAVSKTK